MSFYTDASLVLIPSGIKDQKVYCAKPVDGSGDLVFSRSNDTATRVGSDGLIEKVRTNLLLQSNSFDTTWTATNATLTSGQSGYDGTSDAWEVEATASSTTRLSQSSSITANTVITISTYAKVGNVDFIKFSLVTSGTNSIVTFDLTDGTTYFSTAIDENWESVGGGWVRISATFINVDTITEARIEVRSSSGSATADAGSYVYIQSAQLETGDIATDYIATTTAAVSVGPVADLPRLDYSGGATCPKLLLEGQRTNSAQFSEQTDNAWWPKYQCSITANQAVSPDGYTNADLLTSTASGDNVLYKGGISAGALSFFAKAATLSAGAKFYIAVDGVGNAKWNQDGTISSQTGGYVTATDGVSYGNGWYRFTYVVGSGSVINYGLSGSTSGDTAYVWGIQNEASATYATSYIPTLGAVLTRGADSCSKTGISSLIGQTEGTMFIDFVYTNLDSNGLIPITIGETSLNHAYIYIEGNERIKFDFVVAGYDLVNIATAIGFAVKGTRYKIAFAYKANDFAAYINGQLIGTDNSGAMTALSNFYLSYPYASGYSTPNTVNQALLFTTRLTNAQLAELTTI